MKPKCTKGFVFFAIATLVCFELGNSIRNIAAKLPIDNPVFSFVFAKNSGGAWNILENYTIFLTILGVIAVLFLALYVYKKITFQNKLELISCTLFCAGILGNTTERLTSGHVIDYIKLKFIDFPVFNMFDIMITSAVVLYTVFLVFGEKNAN